jgi:hypothetical protein
MRKMAEEIMNNKIMCQKYNDNSNVILVAGSDGMAY